MSKDKEKKKNKKKVYAYIYKNDKEKKKNKKNKKDKFKNKDVYKKPVKKTINETLSKKEIKKATDIVSKRPETSKELLEYQSACNHAGVIISIPEYRAISATPTAYTPRLDLIEKVFGDKNACICASCYQALVSPSAVSVDKAKEAVAYLHAVITTILPRKKMKKKEIKKFNKLNKSLNKWDDVVSTFETMVDNGYFIDTNSDTDSTSANLNNVSNANYSSFAFTIQ